MASSDQSSRLSNYSIAAAAAVASGGAAHADVFSGDLGLSFGRVGGTAFFNGFSMTSSTYASITAGMGGLNIFFYGFQASTYADAAFSMSIEGSSRSAMFNQLYSSFSTSYSSTSVSVANMVDAGAFWQSSSNSISVLYNQIFWTTTSSVTWTNPDATGTKYVMFFLDGDEEDAWGWLQFDWNISDGDDWSVSLSNWAYSTDGPLAAGDSGTPAVPGLGGLAALAVGAAGVRGRRQRMAG